MKPWQFALIFLACLAVFLPALLFRSLPFGFDSYYYLTVVCNGAGFVAAEPLLSKTVFSLMPCSVLFLLAVNFILLVSCCVFAGLLGEHFLPERGWLAGVFILGSFVLLFSFYAVESEPFAYALCFAAAWLFHSGDWKRKLLAVGLACIACLFWLGSALMLAAFVISWPLVLLPASILFLYFWRENIFSYAESALPNLAVQETWFGYGLLMQGMLFPSLMFIRAMPTIIAPIAFFSLIAFINMKFSVFAAFFLAILAAKQATLKSIGLLKWLPHFGVVLCVLYFWGVSASLPPNQYDLDAVQLAVQEAHGNIVCNQWGFGHLISFFGGNPSDKAGGQQQCVSCINCIMLTFEKQANCRLLKGDEEIAIQVKVYKC